MTSHSHWGVTIFVLSWSPACQVKASLVECWWCVLESYQRNLKIVVYEQIFIFVHSLWKLKSPNSIWISHPSLWRSVINMKLFSARFSTIVFCFDFIVISTRLKSYKYSKLQVQRWVDLPGRHLVRVLQTARRLVSSRKRRRWTIWGCQKFVTIP